MNIVETNLNFNGLTYGNNPKKIILHHAEAKKCSIYDIHQWHKENGWAGCGYHFFVDKQGNICKGRPVEAIGSHCKGQNAVSIGICAEGDYMTETMPVAQKQAIIELIAWLKKQYGNLPVYGHKESMNYETSCPGDNYPLEDVKNSIVSTQPQYSSDFIKSVQHDLQRVSCLEGGEVNADGVLGPKTKAAIKQFRNIVGLPDNENIDSQLVSSLNAITKKPTIGKGWPSNPTATKFIQWWIGISKTGVFDDATVQKVKKWQKAAEVYWDPDGVIRIESWNKILK